MRIAQQVLNLDLAPTILSLAGIEPPETMTGRSLIPLLSGQPVDWRDDWLFIAHYSKARPLFLAVRSAEFKYIRYTKHGIEEQLFDLRRDPDERNNLAPDADSAALLERMRDRMKQLMEQSEVNRSWFDE